MTKQSGHLPRTFDIRRPRAAPAVAAIVTPLPPSLAIYLSLSLCRAAMSTKRKDTTRHKAKMSERSHALRATLGVESFFGKLSRDEQLRRMRRAARRLVATDMIEDRDFDGWKHMDFVRAMHDSPAFGELMARRLICQNSGCQQPPDKYCEKTGASYCSAQCQRADWPRQRQVCRRLQKNISAFRSVDEIPVEYLDDLGGREAVQATLSQMKIEDR